MALNPQAKELWDQIRNPNCTECALHKEAQTVCLVGDGPVPADIMILGEAPGFREDEVSRPFSGKSGRLLDDTLRKYSLGREQAFISNVAKCRPPENRTPNKTEIKACRHYLDDEVEAVKPKFILLLGNSALTLVKKSGIMKQRGQVRQYGDAQVFATVHPAAVLRNPRYADIFETDMAAFARLVRGEEGPKPPKTYLVRDKRALAAACKAILTSKAVAYDLETNGFDEWVDDAAIATIAVAVKPGLVFVVPIHHPEAPWKDPKRVLGAIGHALVFTDAKRIAHNAKFDDRWLRRFGIGINADFDTMIAAHVLDENRFKGLKVLSPMLLGVDAWGIDLADGAAMTASLKKLARYNAKDADYTLRLYYIFRDALKRQPRSARIFAKLLMPISKALTDIEPTGLWVDQERLSERRIEVLKNMQKVNRKLVKLTKKEANWNSPAQIAEILFQDLDLPVINITKGGKPSTAEAVLLQLRHKNAVPNLILEYRKWAKYESTYLGNWAAMLYENRIHANYKITGTVTGRLSSGKEEGNKGRGLNAQQIPRDPFIRSIIGAPPEWRFVEADFSQVELRIAAHYAQEPTMLRLFHTGEDIHLATAVRITGLPPEQITSEQRKKAKSVNFGFLFGMGWKKYIEYARDNYDLEVGEDEAKEVRDRFFRTFPKLVPWHERQRRLAKQYHWVQSGIGRVRHLPDILSEDKDVRAEAERQAINSPVQSLASDMMLLSMTLLHDKAPPDQMKIVGTVHDSLLFEVHQDHLNWWVPFIKHTMENLPLKQKFGLQLSVPIVADMKVGMHWGEAA